MKLATVAEMQHAERECGVPVEQLMENAGLAVAQEAWLMLGELADRKIVVLAGPGNNSGDGLVAARHLKDWGADVTGVLLKPRGEDDANLKALVERDVPVVVIDDDVAKLDEALTGAELMIDALLGTGRARPIEGPLAGVLDKLRDTRSRRLPPRLLAVDLPTGLDADTGAAALSCTGALRVGPGIVTLACARSVYPMLASKLTETTFEPLDDKDGFLSAEEAYSVRRALSRGYEALLVGPGLAQHGYVVAFVRALLPMLTKDDVRAVVIDADGLNNISKVERWWEMLNVPAIITPHPGELSRLRGVDAAEIQRDRLAAARTRASQWGL